MNQLKAQIEASKAAEIVKAFSGEGDEAIYEALRAGSCFEEMIAIANAECVQAEADAVAVAGIISTLTSRKRRHENRGERLRLLMVELLNRAGVRKVELPEATISLGASRQVALITDETRLAPQFVRVKREPDKASITKALLEGNEVAGAELSNGGESLIIRRQ